MVSVWMTSTPQVEILNRKFRGVPKPTAVMSFPQGDMYVQSAKCKVQSKMSSTLHLAPYISHSKVWGDIVIAEDAVRRYARIEHATERSILEEFLAHGLRGLLKVGS